MTKHGLLFLGALIAATSLVAGAGCGDEGNGGSGGAGATGGMGGAGGGMGGAGGGSSTLTCAAYCAAIMSNCTNTNAQYSSMASCMGTCAAFPEGTAMDDSGNTLGCRVYHAGAAKGDPGLHCSHAGPIGNDACGSACDGFCAVVTKTCPTEYPQAGECTTTCMNFMKVGGYNASIASGDSLECRLYHATVAATDAASAMTHCQHTTAVSDTCK
jgi:hypothetical protein